MAMDCYQWIALLMGLASIAVTAVILSEGLRGSWARDPPDDYYDPNMVTDTIVPPPATEGSCAVGIAAQESNYTEAWCNDIATPSPIWGDPKYPACYPLGVPAWHPMDNIIVTLPDPSSCDVAVSETWTVAGWHLTYVQLAPGASFVPPQLSWAVEGLVKLYRGSLLDIGENGIMREDGRWETFVTTPPLMTRSLKVPHNARRFTAGTDGAAFAYFMAPTELLTSPVTNMFAPPASTINGPFSNLLRWRTFSELTQDNAFSNEFWNLPGILVRNYDGSRLNYNQWWTVREDDPVDGGYHNHAGMAVNNTFAELHMTLYAATAGAGMQSQLPHTQNLDVTPNPNPIPDGQSGTWYSRNDMTEVQLVMPMPAGYAHGPIWAVDTDTGMPETCPTGEVMYPWHRLVLGTNQEDGYGPYHTPLRYHLWVAFEHPPQYATINPQMLAVWHNAYLQNTDGDC